MRQSVLERTFIVFKHNPHKRLSNFDVIMKAWARTADRRVSDLKNMWLVEKWSEKRYKQITTVYKLSELWKKTTPNDLKTLNAPCSKWIRDKIRHPMEESIVKQQNKELNKQIKITRRKKVCKYLTNKNK